MKPIIILAGIILLAISNVFSSEDSTSLCAYLNVNFEADSSSSSE